MIKSYTLTQTDTVCLTSSWIVYKLFHIYKSHFHGNRTNYFICGWDDTIVLYFCTCLSMVLHEIGAIRGMCNRLWIFCGDYTFGVIKSREIELWRHFPIRSSSWLSILPHKYGGQKTKFLHCEMNSLHVISKQPTLPAYCLPAYCPRKT